MIDNDEVLESMQADILGILHHTPSLKGHVFKDTEGDFNSRLEKSLGTKTVGSTGKRGLAIIVLQVEVTEADRGLPGPPIKLRLRVLVMENIVINRSATRGTLQRSSQAALNILNTLQLSNLGSYSIYADKTPITPQTVPEGLSSHIVTLYVQSGMNPVQKPLAVQAEMIETGTLTPGNTLVESLASTTAPDFIYTGDFNGRGDYRSAIYTWDGIFPTGWRVYWNGSSWRVEYRTVGDVWYAAQSADDVMTPDLAVFASPTTGTGLAEFTLSSGSSSLSLACASPASTIRYTTDGSYPSPAKTLYTAPITSPQTGTVFRAAAYVAGMPPGDVLEFTIND